MDSRPYSSLKLQRILVCHCDNDFLEDCVFPDSCSLLNVTNRRKAPIKKKNSVVNNESIDMFSVMQQKNELFDMQTEYDDLLVEYKIQRIRKDIEVDCLTKKLTAAGQNSDMTNTTPFTRQLKSPIQQNLDDVIELATENNISAVGNFIKSFKMHTRKIVCLSKNLLSRRTSILQWSCWQHSKIWNWKFRAQELHFFQITPGRVADAKD